MIVQCENCFQRYKLDEAKIPQGGGQIKCRKCNRFFVVKPHSTQDTYDAIDHPANKDDRNNDSVLRLSRTANSPDDSNWRLRLAGLTYAFHGLDSLNDWLLSRDDVNNIKIAKNDDPWKELGDYPEVITPDIISKFFPLGNVPTTKSVEENKDTDDSPTQKHNPLIPPTTNVANQNTPNQAPVRKKVANAPVRRQSRPSGALKLGSALGLLILASILLQLTGIVNFKLLLPSNPAPHVSNYPVADTVDPPREKPAELGDTDRDPKQKVVLLPKADDEKQVLDKRKAAEQVRQEALNRSLSMADEMIQNRQYPEARTVLQALSEQFPDSEEVRQRLERVQRALGVKR